MYEQEKSYLIVLNTIKSSLEFYEEIKRQGRESRC